MKSFFGLLFVNVPRGTFVWEAARFLANFLFGPLPSAFRMPVDFGAVFGIMVTKQSLHTGLYAIVPDCSGELP